MGIIGSVGGGVAGGMIGGPVGVGVGAMAGNYIDDQIGISDKLGLGGPKAKHQTAPGVRGYGYDATGTRYGDERKMADERAGYSWKWGDADQQRNNALEARARQSILADEYQKRINGTAGPSLAEQQLRAGQENNLRQQLNAAAMARGGGGAALAAQSEARGRGLVAGQQLNTEAAMLRTREQQEAEAAYAGLLNNMRGADLAGLESDMRRQGMMSDEFLRSRGLNDSRSMALLQAQIEEQKARMAAEAGLSQLDMQGKTAVINANAAADAAAQNRSSQMQGAMIGAAGQLGAAYITSGAAGGGAPAGGGGAPAGGGGGGGDGGHQGYYYSDSYGQHYVPPGG